MWVQNVCTVKSIGSEIANVKKPPVLLPFLVTTPQRATTIISSIFLMRKGYNVLGFLA